MGIGQSQLGIQPQRFQIRHLGVDQPVEHTKHVAQVMVQDGRIGIEAHRLLAVRQRFVRLAAVQQHLAQVGLGRRERRVQLDRGAEMSQCLVLVFELAQPDSQIVVRHRKVRPQLDGAAKLFDRILVLPETLKGGSEVAQGFWIVGPDRERNAATSGGTLEITESTVRLGQVGVVCRRIGPQGHRATDQLDRARVLTLLVVQHTEQMKRLGVFLLARQNLLVQLGCRH